MNKTASESIVGGASVRTVSVVVVTYNSESVLAGCLAALPDGMAGCHSWEVTVVDNASTDGSAKLARDSKVVTRVVEMGRNAGYAAAINAGVASAARQDAVLVLNPDVRLGFGCAAALYDGLVRSGAGIAAPQLADIHGRLQWSLRRDPAIRRVLAESVVGGTHAGRAGEMVTDSATYERGGWADWATGAALLISAECRVAVGDWDETFFLYSEETDYCQRARRAGLGIRYVPEARATHLGGELETSPTLRRYLVRNKLRLYRATHGRAASTMYRGALLTHEATRAARGSSPHRSGLQELLRPRRPEVPTGIVLFSAQDYWYHNRGHSDVQLARGFATTRPVLLVNSIGMRMPTPGKSTRTTRRILRKLASTSRLLRHPEPELPNLAVLSPIVLPFYGSARWRQLNAHVVRAQVRLCMRRSGIRRPHMVVTIPTAVDVIAGMPRTSLTVNRSDKYSAFEEADTSLIDQMERQLLAECDHALYVSHSLLAAESSLTGERALFLGHGVDFERFAKVTQDDVPVDLRRLPVPRIGFFGGLDDYVIDFDLLGTLADKIPYAQLVLIGAATCSMDSLVARPNVHWLGVRDYQHIAAYGAGFDVGIMPWLQGEWVHNANPIKVKEYLALGLPIVSIEYPEAAYFRDVMAIAADAAEFVDLVRQALDGHGVSDAATRRAKVAGDSWSARAQAVIDLLEPVED
jgi:GT2 family glycosyltransferase/glycosyltransferase involved in cell wall biosynthesis